MGTTIHLIAAIDARKAVPWKVTAMLSFRMCILKFRPQQRRRKYLADASGVSTIPVESNRAFLHMFLIAGLRIDQLVKIFH